MHIVVLDSTALLAAGPTSGPLRDLALSTKTNEVEVHVPELVIREVATNIAQKAAASNAGGLLALGNWSGGDDVQAAIRTLRALKARKAQIVEEVQAAIATWVEAVGGVTQRLDEMETGPVFDDYFLGRGAFKDATKERTRIPDAFIHHYVQRLAEREHDIEDVVSVVTNDKALAKSLTALSRVRVFPTVSELLTRGGVQNWTRIGGLRVHEEDLEALVGDVAMQVVLPGDPLIVDPHGLGGVTVSLEDATEKDGVVYFPFRIVFNEVSVVIDGARRGEADTSTTIGPVTTTGTVRGEVRVDPDGNKFVVGLKPTSVATHAPPGFEGC